jgi:hypothetical protein
MNKRTDLLTIADAEPISRPATPEEMETLPDVVELEAKALTGRDYTRQPNETEQEFFDRVLGKAAPAVETKADDEGFDWLNDDSIIIQSRRATAVYFNRDDNIVIRQQQEWDEESDPFMVITAKNRSALIRALDEMDNMLREKGK